MAYRIARVALRRLSAFFLHKGQGSHSKWPFAHLPEQADVSVDMQYLLNTQEVCFTLSLQFRTFKQSVGTVASPQAIACARNAPCQSLFLWKQESAKPADSDSPWQTTKTGWRYGANASLCSRAAMRSVHCPSISLMTDRRAGVIGTARSCSAYFSAHVPCRLLTRSVQRCLQWLSRLKFFPNRQRKIRVHYEKPPNVVMQRLRMLLGIAISTAMASHRTTLRR